MHKHIKQNNRVCIALMLRQAHIKTQKNKNKSTELTLYLSKLGKRRF